MIREVAATDFASECLMIVIVDATDVGIRGALARRILEKKLSAIVSLELHVAA